VAGPDISLALAASRFAADRPDARSSVGDIKIAQTNYAKVGQTGPLVHVWARQTVNASNFQVAEQINAAAVRVCTLMSGNAAAVLHVTAAARGQGVSMAARELIHAASRMQWCKTLLLDGNPGGNDQSRALGGQLPDIVTGYAERGTIEVMAVESGGNEFHAAMWPSNAPAAGMAVVPVLGRLLQAAYDLIVMDCPPIVVYPHLPAISNRTPQVLLVIRSEGASARLVQRAKAEIEALQGTIWGAILTGQRHVLPRALDPRALDRGP
jgi:Mrp family chromosome partitioning ATPase